MKEIINISMGKAQDNFDKVTSILGEKFHIKSLGVDFDIGLAKKLIEQYKDTADIFTISGFPPSVQMGNETHSHFQLEQLKEAASPISLVDGQNFRELYQPWFLHRLIASSPEIFEGKRIGFFAGIVQNHLIAQLQNLNCELYFADLYFLYNIPKLIKTPKNFTKFLKINLPITKRIKLAKFRNKNFNKESLRKLPLFKKFFTSDIYIVNDSQLQYINLPDLSGKTVLIDHLSAQSKKTLENANVSQIISSTIGQLDLPDMSQTLLEGIFQLITGNTNSLSKQTIMHLLSKLELTPDVAKSFELINEVKVKDKFSFIIHPLSTRDLFRHPLLKPFGKSKRIHKFTENTFRLFNGFEYGVITGIKSEATGKEISGHIYSLFETPKMMMKSQKEWIYRKILNISEASYRQGSKILGLGAYTKIVGDAGLTVARKSTLPITTGNSLSAAATLWAASYAINKMGFVEKDENGVNQGTLVIIGATGSIGKVCSKLLSKFWKRVVIVAPRIFKLVDLKEEILEISPQSEIIYTTYANEYLHVADLVITTTSAQGKKILDIENVQPGAVICDVSRPFDISEDEAISRPDVLIIASGEVELPGDNVNLSCDIGLPRNTVYACLAETALLTLEGRFETFSLSRDISYSKVIEIDKLSRKHGVRLSAIMGHSGEITEEEIILCKQHALTEREKVCTKEKSNKQDQISLRSRSLQSYH